jgi:hypothetical protein
VGIIYQLYSPVVAGFADFRLPFITRRLAETFRDPRVLKIYTKFTFC